MKEFKPNQKASAREPWDEVFSDFAWPHDELFPSTRLLRPEQSFISGGTWQGLDQEQTPASSSGSFARIVRSTVQSGKRSRDDEQPHRISLNLHKFYTDSGDSLGDDPEDWMRLKF
jgi:hypothetical protein